MIDRLRQAWEFNQVKVWVAAWAKSDLTAATILLLAGLHVLSPEFDPSWRVISEYALGRYGWVLSLMFLVWGAGTWALAVAIRSQVKTTAGKVGLALLLGSRVRRGDGLCF